MVFRQGESGNARAESSRLVGSSVEGTGYHEIRGLLNRITPATYEELSSNFCDYRVHQDRKLLTLVVELIFTKAAEEPNFCALYAALCKKQVTRALCWLMVN